MKNFINPRLNPVRGFFWEVTVLALAHLAVVLVFWLLSSKGRAMLSRLIRRFRETSNIIDV